MKKIFFLVLFSLISFLGKAQNTELAKLEKRLFDERKFATTSTDNALSKHFKKYLPDELLEKYQWQEGQEYVFASFELDKKRSIQNFSIKPNTKENTSVNNLIEKAFLKFDFSKLTINNHQNLNQYSFIILQNINDKTIIKASSNFAIKSPAIFRACSFIKIESYKEMCECNERFLTGTINRAVDKTKLSVDYLNNEKDYFVSIIHSPKRAVKYSIDTKNNNPYIDSIISATIKNDFQNLKLSKVGQVNGLDYYSKSTLKFNFNDLIFNDHSRSQGGRLIFKDGYFSYVEKENTELKELLKSKLSKKLLTDNDQFNILKKSNLYYLQSIYCYLELDNNNKILSVKTNCNDKKFNLKIDQTLKKLDISYFKLDTISNHCQYKFKLGQAFIKNNKIQKFLLKPDAIIDSERAPLLKNQKYISYSSTMDNFNTFCGKIVKDFTNKISPVSKIKSSQNFAKILVETSKEGFIKVNRILLPKNYSIENRKINMNKIIGKLKTPYHFNEYPAKQNYTITVNLNN